MEAIRPSNPFVFLDFNAISKDIPEEARLEVQNALNYLKQEATYERGATLLSNAYLTHPKNITLESLFQKLYGAVAEPAEFPNPDAELLQLQKEYEQLLKANAAELAALDEEICSLKEQLEKKPQPSARKRKFIAQRSLPNPYAQNNQSGGVLNAAIEATLLRTYKGLIEEDLNAIVDKDEDGHFLLHNIALGQYNDVKGVINLIQDVLKTGLPVDVRDNEGNTPLHLAAQNDELAIAQALVAAGARLDVKNSENMTPAESAENCQALKTYHFLSMQEKNQKR